MKFNVVAPSVGESITEVSILKWHKQNGEAVKANEVLLEIESDKATVEVVAEKPGVLNIIKQAGERIPIGEVVAIIDDAATATVASGSSAASQAGAPSPQAATAPNNVSGNISPNASVLSPAVKKAVTERGIDPSSIAGTGKDGRITKGDVLGHTGASTQASPQVAPAAKAAPVSTHVDRPGDRRVPMSALRAKIAERLVLAQHTAAALTTFNEVDMGTLMALRNQHKDAFKAKHGLPMSFMTFFTMAAVQALKTIPEVNASVDGRDVIYHDYCDVGIAVGTDRGLVVPVIRGADQLSFKDIDTTIAQLAEKARGGKLSIADMSGGTFTITNGGVYGSLLSTPILNMPQAAILGMHKTQDRAMVINGKVEVRPMMYLALTYDHRLIDGKGAVTFLVTLKEWLENPTKLKLDL
jgi:2-oxoglutarate dehydrogenase E2 component (dihydrolipoamide succinyltransferase)